MLYDRRSVEHCLFVVVVVVIVIVVLVGSGLQTSLQLVSNTSARDLSKNTTMQVNEHKSQYKLQGKPYD